MTTRQPCPAPVVALPAGVLSVPRRAYLDKRGPQLRELPPELLGAHDHGARVQAAALPVLEQGQPEAADGHHDLQGPPKDLQETLAKRICDQDYYLLESLLVPPTGRSM